MKEPKRSHKSSDKKKHKKKHKHASDKKNKSRDRRDTDSSTSSDAGEDAHSQLQRERAAVQQMRHLLAAFPAVKKDLRQLLWALDNGKAVGLEGLSDPELRQQLVQLLAKLQLKETKGQYWLPKGCSPTLSVVGFVFDEAIQPLPRPTRADAAPQAAEAAVAAASAPAAPAADTAAAAARARQANFVPADVVEQTTHSGASTPDSLSQQQKVQRSSHEQGLGDEEQSAPGPRPSGPQLPPGVLPTPDCTDRSSDADVDVGDAADDVRPSSSLPSPAPGTARRRVVGPAMPAPELLAAAAAYAAETEAAGGYGPAPDELAAGADGGDDDMMIGPPPPEFIEADEDAAQDERTGEVKRVLHILRDTERQAAAQPGPSAPKPPVAEAAPPDAYAVLGVTPSTPTADVRKRYWKLSLLVHPDKCNAEGAQEAFQAVAKAAATLQDAAARQQLDQKREDAELWRMAQQAAEQAERERQWRVARGEEPASGPGSTAGAHMPLSRESWMTELPAERPRTAPKPTQVSMTSFSRTGPKPQRGDTSGWTDTPEMRVARAQGLLQDAGPKLLTRGGLTGADGAPPPAAVAAAVAGYNSQHRQKSMLEKHAERRAAGSKKEKPKGSGSGVGQKRAAEGPPAGAAADWAGNHPWRPFDREKDMAIGKTPKTAAALLKDAAGLGSRFASGK